MCEQHLQKKKKKQKQGRLVFHVRSAIYHELSRTQPKLEGKCISVSVDAVAVVWREKRDLTFMTVQKKNDICNCALITTLEIYLHYGF